MIDILVNMLSPIFVPMGVSIADLTSYLTMCKNYVYAILALIIALVVIQVGTHFWVKKEPAILSAGPLHWHLFLQLFWWQTWCASDLCTITFPEP